MDSLHINALEIAQIIRDGKEIRYYLRGNMVVQTIQYDNVKEAQTFIDLITRNMPKDTIVFVKSKEETLRTSKKETELNLCPICDQDIHGPNIACPNAPKVEINPEFAALERDVFDGDTLPQK